MPIINRIAEFHREMTEWRHDLHAHPELLYDVEARRFERGSEATLQAIRETQPGLVLFGHVHQPLVGRVRIGRTECVNVGHFRGTGVPFVLDYLRSGDFPPRGTSRGRPGELQHHDRRDTRRGAGRHP